MIHVIEKTRALKNRFASIKWTEGDLTCDIHVTRWNKPPYQKVILRIWPGHVCVQRDLPTFYAPPYGATVDTSKAKTFMQDLLKKAAKGGLKAIGYPDCWKAWEHGE